MLLLLPLKLQLMKLLPFCIAIFTSVAAAVDLAGIALVEEAAVAESAAVAFGCCSSC